MAFTKDMAALQKFVRLANAERVWLHDELGARDARCASTKSRCKSHRVPN